MTSYITTQDFKKFADGLMPAFEAYIKRVTDASRAPLLKRIEQLETESESMSAKLKNFGFRGVFKGDTTYYASNFVTASGSMFVALRDNPKGAPGSSDDWALCVKRGRDGDRPYRIGAGK